MDTIPPPETVARARRRYAEGVKVRTILAETQMRQRTLTRCLKGEFDDGSGGSPAPITLRADSKSKRKREIDRAALVDRLWRTAERQVEEVEARLAAAGLETSEREGNARTFAIVVKTLRELSALDEQKKRRAGQAAGDSDDERFPRDVDELRRSLARKIDAILAEREAQAPDAGGR